MTWETCPPPPPPRCVRSQERSPSWNSSWRSSSQSWARRQETLLSWRPSSEKPGRNCSPARFDPRRPRRPCGRDHWSSKSARMNSRDARAKRSCCGRRWAVWRMSRPGSGTPCPITPLCLEMQSWRGNVWTCPYNTAEVWQEGPVPVLLCTEMERRLTWSGAERVMRPRLRGRMQKQCWDSDNRYRI